MISKRDRLIRLLPPRFRVPAYALLQKALHTEESEIRCLRDIVPSGKVAIDVGAHNGMYAYPLSNICSRVEAFEPQPSCAAALEGLGRNVRVHRVALSDSEGELMLSVPLVNGIAYTGLATFGVYDGPHETLRVPVRRLDAYHLMNVGFIKIDVEGHEEQVLRGAEATLRREKPTLLIEIEQRHLDHPMTDVFRYLERLGYVGSFLYDGVWRSLDTFSYERDQHAYLNAVSKGDDAAVRGKYVNNFLFTPKG